MAILLDFMGTLVDLIALVKERVNSCDDSTKKMLFQEMSGAVIMAAHVDNFKAFKTICEFDELIEAFSVDGGSNVLASMVPKHLEERVKETFARIK